MTYKQLLDLGFKRNDVLSGDEVFFNQHGYRCFWLEFTLYIHRKSPASEDPDVHIFIEWTPDEQKYELITHEGVDVVSRKEITEDEMLTLCRITNRKQGDLDEPVNYNTVA